MKSATDSRPSDNICATLFCHNATRLQITRQTLPNMQEIGGFTERRGRNYVAP